jgi:hypothetical protein
MTESKSIWFKLQNIDKRILYWVLFIGLILPLIRPIGLPITISPTTRSLYSGIRDLNEGDVVVINLSSETSAWPECLPGLVAATKALIREDAKLIVWGPLVDSGITWNKIVESVPDFDDLEYGRDYVYLGYYTGGEAAVARMASSIRSIFPTDYKGTPLEQLELMTNVDSATDVDMVISSDTGDSVEFWIRQWHTPFGTKVGEIGIAMLGSSLMPFYQSGNVFGISAGVRGGAELERLIGEPAEATTSMDSISLSHLLVVVAVILSNLGYLLNKKAEGQ